MNYQKQNNTERKHKIIWVANYWYISKPYYERAISALGPNYESTLIGCNIDEGAICQGNMDAMVRIHDSIDACARKVDHRESMGRSPIKSINDYGLYIRFLKKEKPGMVVVGSDIGDLKMKLFLAAAILLKIPIIIYCTSGLPIRISKNHIHSLIDDLLYRSKSYILHYVRARIFTIGTLGEYAKDANIIITSNYEKNRLVKAGSKEGRITISPLIAIDQNAFDQKRIRKEMSVPENDKLIILYTECIQEIYGESYFEEMNGNIAQVLKGLMEKYKDISLIIKMHPREDKRHEQRLECIYAHQKTHSVRDEYDLDALLAVADVNVAHFSFVLVSALYNKKAILSINMRRDSKNRSIINGKQALFEASACQELEEKTIKMLKDGQYRSMYAKELSKLRDEYFGDTGKGIVQTIRDMFDGESCMNRRSGHGIND